MNDANDPMDGRLIVEVGRHAGDIVSLGVGTSSIGRSSRCALVLRKSAGVSRQHAQVRFSNGHYVIEDLGSRNGTIVNGEVIEDIVALNDGDLIEISDERIRFRGPSSGSLREVLDEILEEEDETATMLMPGSPPSDESEALMPPPMLVDEPAELITEVGVEPPSLPPFDDTAFVAPEPAFISDALQPPIAEEVEPVFDSRPPSGALPRHAVPPPRPLKQDREITPARGAVVVSAPAKKGRAGFWLGIGVGVMVMIAMLFAADYFFADGQGVRSVVAKANGFLEGEPTTIISDASGANRQENFNKGTTDPGSAKAGGGDTAKGETAKAGGGDTAKGETAKAGGGDTAKSAEAGNAGGGDTAKGETAKVGGGDTAKSAEAGNAKALEAKVGESAKTRRDKPAETSGDKNGSVKSPISGVVKSVYARLGDRVEIGKKLVLLSGGVSASGQRKLRSLRSEKRAFERAARKGNAMAKRELRSVSREIKRLESRSGVRVIRASRAGVVERIAETGTRVRRGDTVVVVR